MEMAQVLQDPEVAVEGLGMRTGFLPWAALELKLVHLQNVAKTRRYWERVQLEEGKPWGKGLCVPLSARVEEEEVER